MRLRTTTLSPEAEGFNLTPLIDVSFLLLVFFMLVTDLSGADRDPVRLPDSPASVPDHAPAGPQVVLTLDETGNILLRGRRLSGSGLRNELSALARLHPHPTRPGVSALDVRIRSDGAAAYRHVQDILRVCGELEIERVSLGTKREGF